MLRYMEDLHTSNSFMFLASKSMSYLRLDKFISHIKCQEQPNTWFISAINNTSNIMPSEKSLRTSSNKCERSIEVMKI